MLVLPASEEGRSDWMRHMSVYTIYADRSEDEKSGNYGFENQTLDGDFKTAFPIGIEFNPVAKAALLDDGTLLQQSAAYQGVPVDMSGLPKKVRWGGGKRKLADLLKTADHFLVSGKLRDVIEALEPGVHQFQSGEVIWNNDTHAASYFWFNICNRLDGMDKENTTHSYNERIGKWSFVEGRRYVVNLHQTAGKHIWIDSRVPNSSVFVSEDFKNAMAAAGVAGVGFSLIEVV